MHDRINLPDLCMNEKTVSMLSEQHALGYHTAASKHVSGTEHEDLLAGKARLDRLILL